jgi:putative ABC transport system permease protein
VRRFFGNVDPIGKQLRRVNPGSATPLPWLQIVGVVGDIRHNSLQAPPSAEVYVPYLQNASRDMAVVVRAASDPKALIPSINQQVFSVDKEQPLYNVRTMEQVMADSVVINRFLVYLLGVFSAVALVLATIGIYGVISYSVTQRTHEIGIRMALGAQPPDITKMIVKQGMRLAMLGIGIGLVVAIILMQLLSGLLFGVGAADPITFLATALLLGLVAFGASYFPARRATHRFL